MATFRQGDRVGHVFDITSEGTVLELRERESGLHLTGGSASKEVVLLVRLDSGKLLEIVAHEARRLD